jgi:hypothetical protein
VTALTDEQREFWDEIGFGPVVVHPGQTLEGARHFTVSSIQACYNFDSIPEPSREVILAELDRRASNAER